MSKFPIDQHQIFAATNGGLDLIQRFIDFKDVNKHFKIRKEGTESANLSKKDGIWFAKDWGEASGFFKDSKHGIHIYAHYTGRTYFEALLELGKELGLIDEKKVAVKNITSVKFNQFQGELNEDNFSYETKDFTDYELETLGPLVTQETCQKYGLYSLTSYSWLKSNDLVQKEFCDVYTVTSSETYPIFGFVITDQAKPKLTLEGKDKNIKVEASKPAKTWVKIYQPKSSDKKYRFSYLGRKPKQHIFGLENLKSVYNKIQVVEEESLDDDNIPIHLNKIERVIICSGDRDSLNMASTGEVVIWFNSETAEITESQIGMLFKYSREVLNVPDLDPTGFDAGKRLALEHLDIKTAWLPESLTKRKDFRGSPMKDFTDFMKINAKFDDKEQIELKSKVKRFLELARPGRFWTEKRRTNKEGRIVGETTYSVNYKNAFNFLKLNGFSRIKDENRKDGYYFIQQDKHILREVSAQEIKDFFNQFLDEKQHEKGLRYFPDDLLNMLIGSEAVSDKKLVNLPTKDFDFTDYTAHSQYLFFKNFIWEVTAKGINEIHKGYHRYVKEEHLIDNLVKHVHKNSDFDSDKVKVLPPLFDISKDENNNYKIEILNNECEFLNYLINGSRVFWEKEMAGLSDEEQIKYKKNNPSVLRSDKLTDDENYIQEMHFFNKGYSIGYLMHGDKSMSKAWCVVAMDDRIVDNNQSFGRTGKSLTWGGAIRCMKSNEYKGARRKDVLDGQFTYEGVTKDTDYLLFDDANDQFKFNEIFTDITGDMTVNGKNQSAYGVSFYDSPKICITTNFAFKNLDPSSMSRMLINSWSDFYHGKNPTENREEFSPRDHFGHDFFSKSWDDHQWNLFINCLAQFASLYLRTKSKIEAPQENLRKRNLKADMGDKFLEWAEEYFGERLNSFVVKREAHDHLKAFSKYFSEINSNLFKTRVRQYSEFKNYQFNPDLEEQKKANDGRFMMWYEGKSEEHFYLRATEESEEDLEETTEKGLYD
ncbi:MAG: hypothetical protein ACOH1X_02755 [Kaistella sp.]